MPDFWEPIGPVTLLPTAPRTSGVTGSPVRGFRRFRRIKLTLEVAAAAEEATDTLDVFVDVDGIPAVHFAQIAGTDGPCTRVAFLEAGLPAQSDFDVTEDPAAGVVRPYVWGDALRARAVVAGETPSFTFGVEAEAQV